MEKSKITLIGTLDKPLEFKTVGAKSIRCLNTTLLEVDSWGEGKEKRRYYPLSFFGEIAEKAEKELNTGAEIKVDAKYDTGKYTNKQGTTVYTHNFVVSSYEILKAGEPRVEQEQSEDLNIDLGEADVELPF
jgi:single-strand DNA-binding protein